MRVRTRAMENRVRVETLLHLLGEVVRQSGGAVKEYRGYSGDVTGVEGGKDSGYSVLDEIEVRSGLLGACLDRYPYVGALSELPGPMHIVIAFP